MSNPETIELFRRLMQQEIDCAERLAAALQREQNALSDRDLVALEQVSLDKPVLLDEMEQRAAAHEGFLTARGLPPGRAGNKAFLQSLAANAAEHGIWRRLQSIAGTCRELNQVNGKLVLLSRARTQRALEILRGTPDNAKTYGKGGLTRNSVRSQFIAAT